jgi:hypothetical protein
MVVVKACNERLGDGLSGAMKHVVLGLLLVIVGCALNQPRPESDPEWITWREDSAGHLLKTRELSITRAGIVSEERYNFVGTGPTYVKSRRLRLSGQQVQQLRNAILAADFRTLPEFLSSEAPGGPPGAIRIAPDAPERFIAVVDADSGQRHAVRSFDLAEELNTSEELRFRVLWHEIPKIVGGPPRGPK